MFKVSYRTGGGTTAKRVEDHWINTHTIQEARALAAQRSTKEWSDDQYASIWYGNVKIESYSNGRCVGEYNQSHWPYVARA